MNERSGDAVPDETRTRLYLRGLASLFALQWLALAIAPRYPSDWALENTLTLIITGMLYASRRVVPLSTLAYTTLFLFGCLHTIGAHYTYSEVPYDDWFAGLTGETLNGLLGWQRNNFDRIVHFLYGLLLAGPIREMFLRVAPVRGFWSYCLPLGLTLASSALYELIEWGAAGLFGGDLGIAYVGTQGDVWDAQKDMALASLGALLAMVAAAAIGPGDREPAAG